ncbi:MAG TPA: rRNA maturation RNase YbeY [Paracoccus solventivorans]|uniref:rRNA maturation RNase YbeY n=1 Tax=Paracoccus solventivorans TaxID=53463 RepID=UPI002C96BE3D|nr:rRNA maturation RNase YbeY [Paracoccus solventivorans]HMM08574.1 rRNA maturation RNase YbeY [Paracoccus solventivorans]
MSDRPLSAAAPDTPVDVVIEDERWQDAGLEALAARAAAATLRHLGLPSAGEDVPEIVVMGCDDDRIAALNADFRGKPQPTNVLSWPSADPAPRAPGAVPAPPDADELGDIAISYDTCAREAAAQGKPLADHATHLLVHAILHLAGYDHEDDADADTMEDAERAILATLDIPDPYREH